MRGPKLGSHRCGLTGFLLPFAAVLQPWGGVGLAHTLGCGAPGSRSRAGGPTCVSNSVRSAQAVVLTRARRSGISVLTHSLAKCSGVDTLHGQRFLLGGACGLPPWELDSGPHISRLVAEPQIPSSASGVEVTLPSTTPHFVANLLLARVGRNLVLEI